jgi:hypothetical protein
MSLKEFPAFPTQFPAKLVVHFREPFQVEEKFRKDGEFFLVFVRRVVTVQVNEVTTYTGRDGKPVGGGWITHETFEVESARETPDGHPKPGTGLSWDEVTKRWIEHTYSDDYNRDYEPVLIGMLTAASSDSGDQF